MPKRIMPPAIGPASRLALRLQLPTQADRLVAEEALHAMNADALIELHAVAGGLARVVADAPHRRRQRVVLDQLAPGRLVVARLGVVEPLLDVLARRAGVVAGRQAMDVVRALVAPGAGLVREARADVQCDCEGFVHHAGEPSSGSSNRPKRWMLRSAPAWMRAITSGLGCGLKRWGKRLCGRRYSSTGTCWRIFETPVTSPSRASKTGKIPDSFARRAIRIVSPESVPQPRSVPQPSGQGTKTCR